MDFNSIGNGNPFYVLRRGEKPLLEVGVVKSKSQPRAKFQTQTPNVMAGMQMQQVIDVVVTLNGKDETFMDIPINVEIAQRGNEVLNPTYAENKQNARVIQSLQEKQKAQEQQLADLKAQNSEMLAILRQLNGTKG